jgi:hypothetical protein
MKKTWIFGVCAAFALLLALVLPGCPAEDDPTSSVRTVQITITGLVSPPTPARSQFYSLSVFREAGNIKSDQTITLLGGQVSQGVDSGPSSGSASIKIPEILDGEYVLVLGASPDMGGPGTQGKMFITGTGSGTSVTPTKVSLNFNSGTATVSFDQFARKDDSSGWTVEEIIANFGS